MDNSLLSMNLEKNFTYHEVLTDSDNAVKDIARLLALGVESEEILNGTKVVKAATPIMDKCWEVVYPKIDRSKYASIEDWSSLLPGEYKDITNAKIANIKDTVILKTKTLPKEITVNNSTAMGVNQDLNEDSLEMYLEIYMPPYLCDSEAEDPIKQRTDILNPPRVNDINGIATGNTRTARNYHHLFMRIFDKMNEEGNGPAENEVDEVTREVIKWNSRSSCWSKLSWYTDFEDKFKAPLVGIEQLGMQMGTVRVPVIGGLTSQSKIKVWANVNASRVALGVMGSPNVDFSDNRYLIGCAYIGQIDSFDFSINDTAGNFGLFCTSSTSPAMGKTEVQIRSSVPAVIKSNSNGSYEVTPGKDEASATKLDFIKTGLQMFNPQTSYELDAIEIPSIPYDYGQVEGGKDWGDRYINTDTIKLYCSFNNQPIAVTYSDKNKNAVRRNIGIAKNVTITPSKIEVDRKDKKKVKMTLTVEDILKAFIGETETAAAMAGTGICFMYGYRDGGYYDQYHELAATLNIQYKFSYYTQYSVQTGGVKRDKFGNPVASVLDTTYGKNTGNGITDFSMYATFTKDYFQRHFFMFASTEEYMQKELYGKSSYTGEYFADRIKVVHSSEGPRGILSGMITIDTSSLYPFDELIVNKDFEKYKDKPEELYVYLPVTAPYCPFSNSSNGRHGIGILKDIKYKAPTTDEEIVKFAINELDRKYNYLKYATENLSLITSSQYGAKITWECEQDKTIQPPLVEILDSELSNIKAAKVNRPKFDENKKDPSVKLKATVSYGAATNTYERELIVRMQGITPAQAIAADVNALDNLIKNPVTENLTLPTEGANGSTIVWSSNKEAIISKNGIVTRPNADEADAEVILTAKVSHKLVDDVSKTFKVVVSHWTKEEEVAQAAKLINWDFVKGKNTNSQAITDNLELKAETERKVKLEWTLSYNNGSDAKSTIDDKITTGKINIQTGEVSRPTFTQGPVIFQLSCKLSKDDVTKSVNLEPFMMSPKEATNQELVHAACTLLDNATVLKGSGNLDLLNITNNLTLPYHLDNQIVSRPNISWSLATVNSDQTKRVAVTQSDYITLTNGSGSGCIATITRPSKDKGHQQIALKATVSIDGADPENKFFDITIITTP